jgi:hypothetical protein
MTQPIALTDSQLAAVMTAARSLAPWRRDAFLRAIAEDLCRLTDIGSGDIDHAIRAAWRVHFDPPDLDGSVA